MAIRHYKGCSVRPTDSSKYDVLLMIALEPASLTRPCERLDALIDFAHPLRTEWFGVPGAGRLENLGDLIAQNTSNPDCPRGRVLVCNHMGPTAQGIGRIFH